jgi:peroxiredoxin
MDIFDIRDGGAQMAEHMMHLRVGDIAPPFALRSGDGQEIRLTDVLSSRAIILVFIRGTW